MKNFEKYIDKIAEKMGATDVPCIVPGDCRQGTCADCFKRWALEEAKEDKQKNA